MKKSQLKQDKIVLQPVFSEHVPNDLIIQQKNVITDDLTAKKSYIFLGKKSEYKVEVLTKAVKEIVSKSNRPYQIDISAFISEKINEKQVIKLFNYEYQFDRAKLYNVKTKSDNEKPVLELINTKDKEELEKSTIIAEAINWARNYQITPPNVLRSTIFAESVAKDFAKNHTNIKVTVLSKKQIEELKMGLILSVNAGSAFEPRVVVLEYNGKTNSKEKTVLVGKGIMYDSGGMSIKPSQFMIGMKYDMSGAAIVAATMKVISQLKPHTNVAAIMMLTDNMISNLASIADAVFTSMNGKTVEVNNTDAEGRLVLADGITYAIRKLNASRIIDIATLTGAIRVALGQTYAGAWASSDKTWEDLQKAATLANENVWRMPFHEDYAKQIRKSSVADLKNTDYSKNAGSNAAAMFLKEFSENKEFIHLDIAAIAEIDEVPQAPLIKTLVEIVSQ